MSRALIFINYPLANPGAARVHVQPDDTIIAADGGARVALSLGLIPHAILGDLDSLTAAEVKVFEDMGVHILRYSATKNETDLELALNHALNAGHSPVVVIGGYGGRLDHTIANLSLLSAPDAIQAGARFDDGITEAYFISGSGVIHGQVGDLVSLLPWGSSAESVQTEGLSYTLNRESLRPYRARGISNQMTNATATVRLKRGLLLCIHQRQL